MFEHWELEGQVDKRALWIARLELCHSLLNDCWWMPKSVERLEAWDRSIKTHELPTTSTNISYWIPKCCYYSCKCQINNNSRWLCHSIQHRTGNHHCTLCLIYLWLVLFTTQTRYCIDIGAALGCCWNQATSNAGWWCWFQGINLLFSTIDAPAVRVMQGNEQHSVSISKREDSYRRVDIRPIDESKGLEMVNWDEGSGKDFELWVVAAKASEVLVQYLIIPAKYTNQQEQMTISVVHDW
jgi:hypothetical protein